MISDAEMQIEGWGSTGHRSLKNGEILGKKELKFFMRNQRIFEIQKINLSGQNHSNSFTSFVKTLEITRNQEAISIFSKFFSSRKVMRLERGQEKSCRLVKEERILGGY